MEERQEIIIKGHDGLIRKYTFLPEEFRSYKCTFCGEDGYNDISVLNHNCEVSVGSTLDVFTEIDGTIKTFELLVISARRDSLYGCRHCWESLAANTFVLNNHACKG